MSQKSMQELGKQLSTARRKAGLTQLEVAKRAKMGSNRYAVIEQGKAKNITFNKLESICKALGVKGKDIIPF